MLFSVKLREIIRGTLILFAGIGGVFVAAINVFILYAPPSKTGAETAVNTIFRFIGCAVGTAVPGELLTLYTAPITILISGVTQVVLAPSEHAFAHRCYRARAEPHRSRNGILAEEGPGVELSGQQETSSLPRSKAQPLTVMRAQR